jgi:ubiquinone biosynthesis protein
MPVTLLYTRGWVMQVSFGPGPLGLVVVLIVLTVISARLLGVRLRWWRALVAGFPGLIVGIIFIWALTGGGRRPRTLPLPAVLLAGLVATMLIAVLLELLAKPGSFANVQGRLAARGMPHPVRSLRARTGRLRRYVEVTRIAGRHGLTSFLGAARQPAARRDTLAAGSNSAARVRGRQLARSLRAALEEGGGIFVKLGQVLSTRSDLLPAAVIAELSSLQDDVAPAPTAEIYSLLAAELGASVHEVFAWFDPKPLAAGSIAQVHRAQLAAGTQVVVKVQRPGIRQLVERDIDILLRLARTLEARADWARQYRVVELAEGFADALSEELDFQVEARNIAAVARSSGIQIPAVHRSLSTSRVLVLDFLEGVSARDAGLVLERAGADRAEVARNLLHCMLRQVMIDGTFHADPHPGNVLVLPDARLALIDFGSVGRLDPLQQAGLRRLLLAVARRDPGELHAALADLAQFRIEGNSGDDLLERALARFIAEHLGPEMIPDAAMFTALFTLLTEFGITFPPVIGGVFRAMVTLEGTLALLAPGFQMMEESRSVAGSLLGTQFAPPTVRDAVTDELIALLPVLRRLPRRLDRITASLERGTLSANMRLFIDARDIRLATTMVNRAVMAFIGASVGLLSVGLLAIHGGPVLLPGGAHMRGTSVFRIFGYLGLFFGVVLILRVVVAIAREGIGSRRGNGTAGRHGATG